MLPIHLALVSLTPAVAFDELSQVSAAIQSSWCTTRSDLHGPTDDRYLPLRSRLSPPTTRLLEDPRRRHVRGMAGSIATARIIPMPGRGWPS